MKPVDPANIWAMDVDSFVSQNFIKEVTSSLIYEPSSTALHPDGLYSEIIFGQIGTAERVSRFGYIDLHTSCLVPLAFKNIIDLKPVYHEIMQGKIYATFNKSLKAFTVCAKESANANTGYSFFIQHVAELKYDTTASASRSSKIQALDYMIKHKALLTSKMLVYPAGFRDIKEEDGRLSVEDVNTLYNTTLSISREIKSGATNELLARFYDGIKYQLQLKLYEHYVYGKTLFEGKRGFGQNQYAHRALACGTRNVITSASMSATSIEDPKFQKHDETLVSVFQAAKMYQPIVVHELKALVYNTIYTLGSDQVAAIDTHTFKVQYVTVKSSDVSDALSNVACENIIALFQNAHMRDKPVIIKDINDKYYYMFLVYDLGDEVYIFRNIDNFKELYAKNHNDAEVDITKVRPFTYVEMMYLAVHKAVLGKFATITRYPAVEIGSIYPTRVKIVTTVESRVVKFSSQYQEEYSIVLPNYPILGEKYIDSLILHPSQTTGLNADYDGDTVSANGTMSNESNNENDEYCKSPGSLLAPSGKFMKTANTNLTRLTLHNLTRIPDED